MKKIFVTILVVGAVTLFTYCSSTKKSTADAPKTETKPVVKKISYQSNVMAIIEANCAPCHFPDKGGNKKPLNTYAGASAQADEILRRIQLAPTERGFMPNRKPKLSDADINTIKQWKADGLMEK
ncbi:MAG: cytochrome c [Bacteroidota bacterium]